MSFMQATETIHPPSAVDGDPHAVGANPGGHLTPEDMKLLAELDHLRAQQRELMLLLGTTRPDRILHDVRNLLQERIFLEAACRQSEP